MLTPASCPTPASCLRSAFAVAMDGLGPFEPAPALAIAVSGGADSMALSILARDWAGRRGGAARALVVDHGLRPSSGDEARVTVQRLTRLEIPARLLTLADLRPGSALAERARIMRYQALTDACREAGILHLLLGHHAADQAETLAMRVLRGSQTHGLAGMSAVTERAGLRLLRPLLAIEASRLRDFLIDREVGWIEDPSNRDIRALRPRLRHHLTAVPPHRTGLSQALAAVARLRAREECDSAAELARRATIWPEGFALLSPGRIGSLALRCLIQTIGGAAYAPNVSQIGGLAAHPRPATLGGVRIMPAGRYGDGLLIVREEAAVAGPIAAFKGAIWDNRFHLVVSRRLPDDATIGKLGSDATRFRHRSNLPSAVLRTVAAIRVGKVLAAVPQLGYGPPDDDMSVSTVFSPRRPAGGASFHLG